MVDVPLPREATPFERGLARAINGWDELDAAIGTIRTAKLAAPPPAFIPFLIHEYGLGELTHFVSDLYRLLDEGVTWQRIRGTHAAISMALNWLDLGGVVEEAGGQRTFWSAFQLHFAALPQSDEPLLDRVETAARLSVPLRSRLRRGTFEYDIRTVELERGRLDQRRLDSDSGTRLRDGGTLWSFGRTTEISHQFTKREALALGFWIEPDWTGAAGVTWAALNIPWLQATFPWSLDPEAQRRTAMLKWFDGKQFFVRLDRADGTVIGWRRARFAARVRPQAGGRYRFEGASLALDQTVPTTILVEALTEFDDADGVDAAKAVLVTDPVLAPGVPHGRLWLAPGDVSGGTIVASRAVALPLRKTVRERLKFNLRFDVDPPKPKALVAIGAELNGMAIDFTDDSMVIRQTPGAEQALGQERGLAVDFTDDSYAMRT